MQLLGTYQSQLSQWYYNELINLVNLAISKGDYAGGYTFDQTNIETLVTTGQLFTNLALPTAGTRSLDEDFNNTLSLLAARFDSISQEITTFTAKISVLIDILNKDTDLLDQLICAAELNVWANSIPKVLGSTMFSCNFGVGFGYVGFNLPKLDPNNSVVYPASAQLINYFDLTNQTESYGLTPGSSITSYKPEELNWVYESVGLDEVSYGLDWAELDFLEEDILLTFNSPQLEVVLPDNNPISPFQVTGVSTTKGIPIYVRTLFTPRTTTTVITTDITVVQSGNSVPVLPGDQVNISTGITTLQGTDGSCSLYLQYHDKEGNLVVDSKSDPVLTLIGSLTTAGTLTGLVTISSQSNIATCSLAITQSGVSTGQYNLADTFTINTPIRLVNGYSIDPTSVAIFSNTEYYNLTQDFVVNAKGFITLINVPDSLQITISFVEYYPSYQCSINQSVWSQIIMFDYQRPFPDNETEFLPIPIGVDSNGIRNKLPIIDESGLPTGLYIALTGVVPGEYLLKVYQDADSSNPGKQVQLSIQFGQPRFMNVLNLSSYTNFPVNIKSIDAQGFTADTLQNLFSGDYLLDKPVSIRFPVALISSITITFLQENYTIKQHQLTPDDYVRREAINNLQAVIPVNAQEPNILPQVVFANGYQYEFGIEKISGVMDSYSIPTVFISGPYTVTGRSSSITLNSDYQGSVSFYLCFNSFDANGGLIQANTQGYELIPGVSAPFPFVGLSNSTVIDHTDLYLKIVFRSINSSVKAFVLQVD